MKYLIFIFAAYLCGLTFVPCPDATAACADGCTEEMHLHETAEDHQGESEQDVCSPFCFCHCCQIHKLVTEISESAFILPSHESNSHLTLNFFSKEVFSIWHPPKG